MRVAVISDIHDNLNNLDAALSALGGVEALICCGDLCSPFVVNRLGEGFRGPVHIVFGNNDGDRFRIALNAGRFPHITVHGELAELDLGGRKIAVHHFDDVGRLIAAAGKHDVVCFGHNHRFEIDRVGRTLLINPGEVMGGLSGVATYVIYDTERDEATRYEIEPRP
ncbi:MAG TPA: YfcE family phosphodiesterase [Thermomicrobiales bacterium]